jgi:signal transduction histidine kinase
VAVPLVSSDHVLGVLALRLPADQPPRAGLEPLLELMGRQMGMAIQNAQLYQRTDAQLHAKVAELTRALATVEQERSRAQASERAKEEFVSMVSHDLRSPLSVILSDASDYGRTCRDEACQASRASTRGAVRRASAMLTELVDSARLESGALVLRRDRLDLVALLRELAGTGFPAEERARLRLTGDLPAAPLLGDRGWLERAIGNVLGNALKFAPAASPVAVRLARQASAWRLEVIDLGPGIPAAELPLLFNRYFRASNAQWTAGSGLGLYITRLVVEALGGQVEVASELGRGTTVALTLPAFPGGSAGG